MTTVVRNGKTLQVERERLNADGIVGEIETHLQPKHQWYRQDGTPIFPDDLLGPADPYHVARFYARGWTMSPHPEAIVHQVADDTPDYDFTGFSFDMFGYGVEQEEK